MDDLPCGGVLCPVALHRSHNRSLLLYNPASFGMRITYAGDRGDTVVAWSSPPNEATYTSNDEKDPLKMDDLPCGGGVCPVALHRSHMHSLLLYIPASFGIRVTCVGDRGDTVVAWSSHPYEATYTSNEKDPL